MQCLDHSDSDERSDLFGCKVVGGSVIVHCIWTTSASTFWDRSFFHMLSINSEKLRELILFLMRTLRTTSRKLRQAREVGEHAERFLEKFPENGYRFYKILPTKQNYFHSCPNKFKTHCRPPCKVVRATNQRSMISLGTSDHTMSDCDQVEADTKILVHVKHVVHFGS